MGTSVPVTISQRPYGPRIQVYFPGGQQAKPKDIVSAFRAALQQAQSNGTGDQTPASVKTPNRVFQKVLVEGTNYWRELLPFEALDIEAGIDLCVADHTPPASPATSDDDSLMFSRKLEIIRLFLIGKDNVWRVLLFGSALDNPQTANDIDIAIECRANQDPSDLVRWEEQLTEMVGKEVDITDLSGSFHNDMLAIRSNGRYIDFGGGTSDDIELKGHQNTLARAIWRMGKLQQQEFENFAKPFLFKVKALPNPKGGNTYQEILRAFEARGEAYTQGGPMIPTPQMLTSTWNGLEDLRCFQYFSRKQYVDDYNLDVLSPKLQYLRPVIAWATTALLAVGLP
ncbi:hypothetical protein HKX48_001595 [Thoreauomyces humboldtii]|nr:hypothetical protein HKX48_001595 [Thoreauomyces humboldtii]